MQDYDVTLKQLLRRSWAALGQIWHGATVTRWLDVELPRVQNPRVDLLAESNHGELLHLELQSN